MSITFAVSSGEGHLCQTTQEPDISLKQLKEAVQREINVPVYEQKLYYQGREFMDMAQIAGGSKGKTVELFLSRRTEHVAALLEELDGIVLVTAVKEWFKNIPAEDKEEYDVVMAAVTRNGEALEEAPESMQENQEIVIAAVSQNGMALKFADPRLRSDRIVVLVAVRKSGLALQYADPILAADKGIAEMALKADPRAYGHIVDALKTDIYLKRYAQALPFIPTTFEVSSLSGPLCTVSMKPEKKLLDLKNLIEKETEIPAFEQKLIYNGQEMRRDIDLKLPPQGQYVALLLTQRNPDTAKTLKSLSEVPFDQHVPNWAQDLSEEDRGDTDIALAAIDRAGEALEHFSQDVRANPIVVLEAVRKNGGALRFAPASLRGDKALVLEAVRQRGMALEFASTQLRADREVILVAVAQDRAALNSAPSFYLMDPEVRKIVGNLGYPPLGDTRGCCHSCTVQ